jgi:RND family efflux transporter MFP subunit
MKWMKINMTGRISSARAKNAAASGCWLVLFYCTLLSTFSLGGCSKTAETAQDSKDQDKDHSKDQDKEAKTILRVPITRVVEQSVSDQLDLPGVVFALPDRSVKVSPGVAGKVVDVRVSPGEHVTKGQVIALLDNRQLTEQLRQARAKVLIAKAGVEQARTNLLLSQNTEARTASLVAQDVGAQKDLVAAKSQVDTAVAQMAAARAQVEDAVGAEGAVKATLTYTVVKSPISGEVAQRYLNISDTADTVTPIVQIVDLDQIIVDAALPTSQPAKIRIGETAVITSKALPDLHLSGTVQSINPVTDNQGTTVGIRIICRNLDHALKEGMPVIASIVTALHPHALTVPSSAVVADPQMADRHMVYLYKDGKINRVNVSTGIQKDSRTEILSGLNAGQQIVATGAYGIPDGTEVEAQSEPLHANSKVSSQGD